MKDACEEFKEIVSFFILGRYDAPSLSFCLSLTVSLFLSLFLNTVTGDMRNIYDPE
jgi:hypothetical protein